MRQYVLSDRDFEEFYAVIEKIELESEYKSGSGPLPVGQTCGQGILDTLRRTYRYHLIGWRNRMMSGDTYHRGPEVPRDNMAAYLRQEIKRLTELLPPEPPTEQA